MNMMYKRYVLEKIKRNPRYLEFFEKYGYVKKTGCKSKTHKMEPTVTLMLPVEMTDQELWENFKEWEKGE